MASKGKLQMSRSKRPKSKPSKIRRVIGAMPASDREFETKKRCFHVIARMHNGLSLESACKEEGTTPATVKKYLPKALRRSKGRRWKARKNDTYIRFIRLPGLHGPETVPAPGYREAQFGSFYLASLTRWARTEKAYELAPFHGKSIGGYQLITATRTLLALRDAGLLHLDNLYAALKEAV